MGDPKVGDELTNRFGERCVIRAVHDDHLEIAVHRKPETAYWDFPCWEQEVRAATPSAEQKVGEEAENKRMREALEQIAPWLRNGDYDSRGGMIEMDRLAGIAESALPATSASTGRNAVSASPSGGPEPVGSDQNAAPNAPATPSASTDREKE